MLELAILGLLADLGYIGLHPEVVTGYKRKRGEDALPEGKSFAAIDRIAAFKAVTLTRAENVLELALTGS